jgi:hypothetical protein
MVFWFAGTFGFGTAFTFFTKRTQRAYYWLQTKFPWLRWVSGAHKAEDWLSSEAYWRMKIAGVVGLIIGTLGALAKMGYLDFLKR